MRTIRELLAFSGEVDMVSANRIKALIASWLGSALVATLVRIAVVQVAFAQELRRLVAFHETIEISRCERFVAAEEFGLGRPIGGRALSAVGFNFITFFLKAAETDVRIFPLQAWTLRYSADGPSLIKHLGGEDRALVPLCSIYRLMEKGDKGGSHTDLQSNFAFVRSPVGGRVMAVHWFVNHGNEWVIGAVDVPHPQLDFPPGSRVFSPAIVKAEDASR